MHLVKNDESRSTLNLQAFLAPPRRLTSTRMTRGEARMLSPGSVL
jgi:hypothetical protein